MLCYLNTNVLNILIKTKQINMAVLAVGDPWWRDYALPARLHPARIQCDRQWCHPRGSSSAQRWVICLHTFDPGSLCGSALQMAETTVVDYSWILAPSSLRALSQVVVEKTVCVWGLVWRGSGLYLSVWKALRGRGLFNSGVFIRESFGDYLGRNACWCRWRGWHLGTRFEDTDETSSDR